MKKKNTFLKIYLISFIFLLTLFAGLFIALRPHSGLSAHASSLPASYKLSEMTDEQCIEFIKDNNIEIPEEFADSGTFVHDVIRLVEEKPNIEFTFNYNVTLNFAENIKALVNDYYGVRESDIALFTSSADRYELKYNWVQNEYGDWVSSGGVWNYLWLYYNCYAYAIGETENVPMSQDFFAYQPGYFGGTGKFNRNEDKCSIYDLALIVRDDLVSLGYDVCVSNTEPTEIASNQSLICVRRGPSDYHFMRKNLSDGYWYHKPGRTAPLKYKYSPEQFVWGGEYGEYSKYCVEGQNSTYSYDSDIYYITFGTPFTTAISGDTCIITGVKQGITISGSLTIPENIGRKTVTWVGTSALSRCTALTSVTIPATVTIIGTQAFYGCSSLEKVIILNKSKAVTLGSEAFTKTSDKLKICVPEELYDTYTTATNWSGYTSRLDKLYLDANGYYYEKSYQNISMKNNINLSTHCLRTDGSYDILEGTGIIGGFNGISVSLCDMFSDSKDYSNWAFYESELVIYIEGVIYGGCYIYDNFGNYVDDCTYSASDKALYVPLDNLLQMNESSFVLVPEVSDNGSIAYTVGFDAGDVYLNFNARIYI